jgi:hypothetical protein
MAAEAGASPTKDTPVNAGMTLISQRGIAHQTAVQRGKLASTMKEPKFLYSHVMTKKDKR